MTASPSICESGAMVAHDLPKVGVAGSSPVSRSIKQTTTMSDSATITISRIELKRMLDAYRESMLDEFERMVARAITKASIDSGQSSPSMSQAAAFKMYGRRTVEHWVEIGKLHPFSRGNGNRKVFLVEQLQHCAKTSNFKRN